MKKLHILISLVILTSLVLGACAKVTPTIAPTAVPPTKAVETKVVATLPDLKAREITVAVENAYLPFNFVSLKTGQAEGWDYDFINEACKRLNCKIQWVEFAWDTMIASVADGQFDMAADGITITAERAKSVDFSDGYVSIQQRLMVRGDETRFTNIDEFKTDAKLLLAEQVGTTNYQAAKEAVGESRIKSFDTFGMAVQALMAGDVDGVIIDEVAGMGYLGANKEKVKLIGTSISSDQLGFIFPKGSDLVKPFNAVIAAMKTDGFLDKINLKWFALTTAEIEATAGGIGPGAYKPTPTPVYGTVDNPIIMAMAPSATSQTLIAGGEAVAAKLTELTGLTIKTIVPTSYSALIEAMGSGNAHIGWLPPLAYIVAKTKGYADVGLIVVRFGSDHYGAQFIANVASGFTAFFDPATNKNTGDAVTALKQFEGKKPCWTDPLSASGYVIPLGFINANGIKTPAAAFVQGHPTVVRALYATGICDFGATYIDARTNVQKDLPDVLDKVVVIWRTDPVIPNDNVSFATGLPDDIKQKITDALVQMSASDDGKALLKSMGYDVESLKVTPDTFYDEFRVYLQATGIDVTTLVK